MRPILPLALAVLALAACSQKPEAAQDARPEAKAARNAPAAAAAPGPKLDPAQPAGTYHLDPMHSTVTFRVSHIGFSQYVAGFDRLAGVLEIDPKAPQAARVQATIDVRSLDLPAPPAGFKDDLMGPLWFDAARCPQISFRSTQVTPTGPDTADILGDLTLKCVTKPVTLKATFNGGYPPNSMDPYGARIGFSATTAIRRSAFGLTYGIPAPGSNMGVGDEVQIAIETEFSSRKEPATPPAQ